MFTPSNDSPTMRDAKKSALALVLMHPHAHVLTGAAESQQQNTYVRRHAGQFNYQLRRKNQQGHK